MAVFIVLWPYLLTTKLKSVIRHNLGHSTLLDLKAQFLNCDTKTYFLKHYRSYGMLILF